MESIDGSSPDIVTTDGWRREKDMCTRILCKTGNDTYIVGRTMDWNDPSAAVAFWVLPRGTEQDGTAGDRPIKWTSKYGSVIISIYDGATNEGVNEKGLAINVLYLAEAEYGDAAKSGKPTLSIGAWAQYFLDGCSTVKEAVDAAKKEPFAIVAPVLPNGRKAGAHLALSDFSGDSAIFEYLEGGKLVVHHGRQYTVMTNSPPYDQQLAINAYWDLIGGSKFLPGTINAADRFVRVSYNLKSSPEYKDPRMAVASVFSQVRAISTPLGMTDPEHPNISPTLWRSVLDCGSKVYYFETFLMPSVMWVDLNKVDFKEGSGVRNIPISGHVDTILAGDVTTKFVPAEPIRWMSDR